MVLDKQYPPIHTGVYDHIPVKWRISWSITSSTINLSILPKFLHKESSRFSLVLKSVTVTPGTHFHMWHILPKYKQHFGNMFGMHEIVGRLIELFAPLWAVNPKTINAECRAFLYYKDSTINPYCDSQICRAKTLLDLCHKRAFTSAVKAYDQINLQWHHNKWTHEYLMRIAWCKLWWHHWYWQDWVQIGKLKSQIWLYISRTMLYRKWGTLSLKEREITAWKIL